ncbi:MAG TPA: sulfite exporter TauE/SafE family protein [Chitinophagales bacterium]|nr:sulfite exporter TauE/SafE family protein [Chitinophagales bacterium]
MIWSGFILGFLGSFHCIGMCGPLAMALPDASLSNGRFIAGRVLYNFGRAVTYALMGALFGLIGYGFYFSGIQQAVSIAIGILLLLGALPLPGRLKNWGRYSFSGRLKKLLVPLFQKTAASSLFVIGLLNGLLPCGFVYMGIAGAILTGSILNGALFMFLFGLGTFPMMMLLSVSRRFATPKFRFHVNRWIPYIAMVIGILLILRGFNLGIPYVSPDLSKNAQHAASCCHK